MLDVGDFSAHLVERVLDRRGNTVNNVLGRHWVDGSGHERGVGEGGHVNEVVKWKVENDMYKRCKV